MLWQLNQKMTEILKDLYVVSFIDINDTVQNMRITDRCVLPSRDSSGSYLSSKVVA